MMPIGALCEIPKKEFIIENPPIKLLNAISPFPSSYNVFFHDFIIHKFP